MSSSVHMNGGMLITSPGSGFNVVADPCNIKEVGFWSKLVHSLLHYDCMLATLCDVSGSQGQCSATTPSSLPLICFIFQYKF